MNNTLEMLNALLRDVRRDATASEKSVETHNYAYAYGYAHAGLEDAINTLEVIIEMLNESNQ